MKIVRKLQNVSWEYDFEKNELHLVTATEDFIVSRTHTYSLGRFLVRVWQRLASKRRKPTAPAGQAVLASISEPKISP